jgi:hypothetical protein
LQYSSDVALCEDERKNRRFSNFVKVGVVTATQIRRAGSNEIANLSKEDGKPRNGGGPYEMFPHTSKRSI